jgi:hypothetical protein
MKFRVNTDHHVEFEDHANGCWRRPTPVDVRYFSYHERVNYVRLVESTMNTEREKEKAS